MSGYSNEYGIYGMDRKWISCYQQNVIQFLGKSATCCTQQFYKNEENNVKIVLFSLFLLTLIVHNFGCKYHKGKVELVSERGGLVFFKWY